MSNSSDKNNDLFSATTAYKFEKMTFVVEPVFKSNSSETLGKVLLRLLKSSNNISQKG